jgi:anti-sigma factor ChrR (cupin superfamily)
MAPTHHPSAQALANFLIGDCSPGAALLLTRHVELCPRCASRVQALGAAGVAPSELTNGETQLLQPGVEITAINGASGLGEAVYTIKIAPEQALLQDLPLPLAELLVLEGALVVDGKSYRKGDFLALDQTPKKELVGGASGCTCLVTAHDPEGGADL